MALHEQLTRLEDANAELQAANDMLESMREDVALTLETRSTFFSSASHDFRQRLHAMKLLAHSAVAAATANGQVISPLNRLAESVEDLEDYVTDVLDFARVDGRFLQPARQVIELQQLFQKLDLVFEGLALKSQVQLNFRTTDWVLQTDPAMLQRILENLVSNAIKFTTNGVLVAARRRGAGLSIEVWDQGHGIDPDVQCEIFSPFYQAAAHRREQSGVGLGLAVVQRFADCLGYQVSVRSRVGRGSVLAILVPARDVVNVVELGVAPPQ